MKTLAINGMIGTLLGMGFMLFLMFVVAVSAHVLACNGASIGDFQLFELPDICKT